MLADFINMKKNKLIRFYYFITPLFFVVDLIFDVKLRVSIPVAESETFYYLYIAACFVLGTFVFKSLLLSSLFGLVESSVNILLLILSVMLPIFNLAGNFDTMNSFSFGVEEILHFLIAGSILLLSFHLNPLMHRKT